jgi:MOSC domain-containing protein YiiM
MILSGLFVGTIKILKPEGQHTGIFKQPVDSANVTLTGINEDHQADKRVHGGAEKALHQYAINSYALIGEAFPQIESTALPGSLGENISCKDMSESSVNIGDIYSIGAIKVQVSQPRSPCWKINHRFGVPGLSRFIADEKISGWYYRIIEPGRIHIGDRIQLLDRLNPGVSVCRFLEITNQHRPELEELQLLINSTGLSPEWMNRLLQRYRFLQEPDHPV